MLRNGRPQITATVVNSAMLDRWLLGFGRRCVAYENTWQLKRKGIDLASFARHDPYMRYEELFGRAAHDMYCDHSGDFVSSINAYSPTTLQTQMPPL